jgi:PPOX class probable F420-dependent enzyme
MASGACADLSALPEKVGSIVAEARRAVLATTDAEGRAHAVPVCFAVRSDEIVSALDHKPKSGRKLARLRHIEATGRATVLVDRWSEDWERLGWVMARGSARIDAPGTADGPLAARYQQYRAQPPRGPVIALRPEHVLWWAAH